LEFVVGYKQWDLCGSFSDEKALFLEAVIKIKTYFSKTRGEKTGKLRAQNRKIESKKSFRNSFRNSLREWGFYIAKQPRAALKED